MTEIEKSTCIHPSFTYELIKAEGTDAHIGIVRCKRCGTAVSAMYPQVPHSLNVIESKINTLLEKMNDRPAFLQRLALCAAVAAALPDGIKQALWEKMAQDNPEEPRKSYIHAVFQTDGTIQEVLDSIK
jgi:hypothetical protein